MGHFDNWEVKPSHSGRAACSRPYLRNMGADPSLLCGAVAVAAAAHIFLERHKIETMFAVGGNKQSATHRSQCNTVKMIILWSSEPRARGNHQLRARTRLLTRQRAELQAVAACVIGGLNPMGGRQHTGIFLGAALLFTIQMCCCRCAPGFTWRCSWAF